MIGIIFDNYVMTLWLVADMTSDSSIGPSACFCWEGFKAPIVSFHHEEFFNELL
jgi:hypothetical protein